MKLKRVFFSIVLVFMMVLNSTLFIPSALLMVYAVTPEVTAVLTNTPGSLTNIPDINISVGGTGVDAYKYKIDTENYSAEMSKTVPIKRTGLGEGQHTLNVIARDTAGVWQSEGNATSYTWTVDLTAQNAPVISGTSLTNNTNPTWNWLSGGGDGTYRYKLDDTNILIPETETTSLSYTPVSGLTEGLHTLHVREKDSAGNWSAVGSYSIMIDTTKPTAGTGINFSNITATSMTVNWGSAADSVTLQADLCYKLVKAANAEAIDTVIEADAISGADLEMDWTADTVTKAVTGLNDGTTYYFVVLVKDAAGNKSIYIPAGQMTNDVTAPTKGTGISFTSVAATSMTVNWGAATDSVTVQANLQYKLVKASALAAIDTVEEADAVTGADLEMDWTANTVTKAVTGLTDYTTYYFAVLVKDAAGNKALYTPASQLTLDGTSPTAGTGISFTSVAATSMTVNWGTATDSVTAQANLQYKLVKAAALTAIDTVEEADAVTGADLEMDWTADSVTKAVTGLSDYTTYYFAVLVKDEAGNKAIYTPASQLTPDGTSPTAGTGISFVGVTATSMTVNWGEASDSVTAQADLQYKLVKAAASTAIDTVLEADAITGADLVTDWTANVVTESVTGLSSGTAYYFAILVKDAAGNKALYSPVGQVTLCAAPAGLGASSGNEQAELSWTGSTGAASYKVYCSTTSGSGYTQVASDIVTNSYTATGLTNGTTYYFVVKAVNAVGDSQYSNEASAIPDIISSGDGTPADPFKIYTIEELAKVGTGTDGWNLSSSYILMNDLDFNSTSSYSSGVVNSTYTSGTGWTPIAADYNNPMFTGNFDGNGYKISNLYINGANSNYCYGLFGNVGDGVASPVIKNLGMENVNVTGSNYASGLVGYVWKGIVENCYSKGTVNGYNAGGLIGAIQDSFVNNCYSTANVSGTGTNGGLIGSDFYMTETLSKVYYCYATGTVTNTGIETGGLIGSTTICEIKGCYATGNVNGSTFTGGLVGAMQGGSSISDSYALGNVSSDHYGVGGLVGNMNGSTVTNCYSKGTVASNDSDQCATNVAGLVGAAQSGSSVSYSIAGGSSVSCSSYYGGSGEVNRVVGRIDSSTVTNVYAKSGMTLTFGGSADSISVNTSGGDGGTLTDLITTASQPLSNWEFNTDSDGNKIYWKIDGGMSRPVLYVDPDGDGTFSRLGTDNGL